MLKYHGKRKMLNEIQMSYEGRWKYRGHYFAL